MSEHAGIAHVTPGTRFEFNSLIQSLTINYKKIELNVEFTRTFYETDIFDSCSLYYLGDSRNDALYCVCFFFKSNTNSCGPCYSKILTSVLHKYNQIIYIIVVRFRGSRKLCLECLNFTPRSRNNGTDVFLWQTY